MSHVGKCDCMTRHVLRKVTASRDTLERVTTAWHDTCPRARPSPRLRARDCARCERGDQRRVTMVGAKAAGWLDGSTLVSWKLPPYHRCLGPAVMGWSNVWSLWSHHVKCSSPIGIVPPNQVQTINLSVSNNNNVYVENINMAFVSMFDHPNLNMSTYVFVNVSSLSVFSIRKYLQWGLWPTSSRQICTVYRIHWPKIGAHTFVVLG